MASKIVRFNTAGLFFVGLCEVACKPETIDGFEENIRRVIADIRPQMLQKMVENWASLLEFIRAILGGHLTEIIFKT